MVFSKYKLRVNYFWRLTYLTVLARWHRGALWAGSPRPDISDRSCRLRDLRNARVPWSYRTSWSNQILQVTWVFSVTWLTHKNETRHLTHVASLIFPKIFSKLKLIKKSQNKKISQQGKFQNWIWTRCDKVRVTWPHEASHVSVTFR